jgi:hypothetical protein
MSLWFHREKHGAALRRNVKNLRENRVRKFKTQTLCRAFVG